MTSSKELQIELLRLMEARTSPIDVDMIRDSERPEWTPDVVRYNAYLLIQSNQLAGVFQMDPANPTLPKIVHLVDITAEGRAVLSML